MNYYPAGTPSPGHYGTVHQYQQGHGSGYHQYAQGTTSIHYASGQSVSSSYPLVVHFAQFPVYLDARNVFSAWS